MAPVTFTNKLINESSPYLLQHAHNPVDWHPWNDETLRKAESLDRMMLISIGYSACHWCHVMEKESFTDEKVAEIMNRYFICIKVDREERPDVDQVYMTAVQLITGGGGWPLNCFALPDGRPFFGGTYFRREQWVQLMENVQLLFSTRRNDLTEQAESLTQGVMAHDVVTLTETTVSLKKDDILLLVSNLKGRLDFEDGGMAGAPKFPMPAVLSFLQKDHFYSKDNDTRDFLNNTLQKMAFGGIYDQVGGGFARYSTDAHWKVPHFEKMLYDNAQLVPVYCRSYQSSQEADHAEVVRDTLAFVLRELTHPSGGFFSSLDADSEGSEGKYYTWSMGEFRLALESHADLLVRYYNLGGKGLWESGRNILLRTRPVEEFAQGAGLQPSQFRAILRTARTRLLKVRAKRVRPSLDDKILTSWNALMLKGFAHAYDLFGKNEYQAAAINNAHFLLSEMMQPDGRLHHTWKNGKAYVNGFLEDYCFLIEALLELFQVTFEREYLDKALLLTGYAIKHFYDPKTGLFYVTSSLDAPLIARKKEVYDNVIPSSNSVMAGVLHKLGLAFEREEYLDISSRMLMIIKDKAIQHPAAFANWAAVMMDQVYPFYTVAVAGPDALKTAREIKKQRHPSLLFCGSETESDLPILKDRFVSGKTMIYLCSGSECKLPTDSAEQVMNFLKSSICQ
jgi:uncharacterized protein